MTMGDEGGRGTRGTEILLTNKEGIGFHLFGARVIKYYLGGESSRPAGGSAKPCLLIKDDSPDK
ncbi:hypothetical protein FG05_35438 [Fusarium graminearum]|nr:hypothetical protein FG05_35438 [Fusarium graminearum]